MQDVLTEYIKRTVQDLLTFAEATQWSKNAQELWFGREKEEPDRRGGLRLSALRERVQDDETRALVEQVQRAANEVTPSVAVDAVERIVGRLEVIGREANDRIGLVLRDLY